jgi:hypothetical protein
MEPTTSLTLRKRFVCFSMLVPNAFFSRNYCQQIWLVELNTSNQSVNSPITSLTLLQLEGVGRNPCFPQYSMAFETELEKMWAASFTFWRCGPLTSKWYLVNVWANVNSDIEHFSKLSIHAVSILSPSMLKPLSIKWLRRSFNKCGPSAKTNFFKVSLHGWEKKHGLL